MATPYDRAAEVVNDEYAKRTTRTGDLPMAQISATLAVADRLQEVCDLLREIIKLETR